MILQSFQPSYICQIIYYSYFESHFFKSYDLSIGTISFKPKSKSKYKSKSKPKSTSKSKYQPNRSDQFFFYIDIFLQHFDPHKVRLSFSLISFIAIWWVIWSILRHRKRISSQFSSIFLVSYIYIYHLYNAIINPVNVSYIIYNPIINPTSFPFFRTHEVPSFPGPGDQRCRFHRRFGEHPGDRFGRPTEGPGRVLAGSQDSQEGSGWLVVTGTYIFPSTIGLYMFQIWVNIC